MTSINANSEKIRPQALRLYRQLSNDRKGDFATLTEAIFFKDEMQSTMLKNIPSDKRSLINSLSSTQLAQDKLFKLMIEGQPLTKESTDSILNTHFNYPHHPNHLHLSCLGTNDHSIDIIFTKNEKGMFVTVCNRGNREGHDIFETYQLNSNGNATEASNLLVAIHTNEKKDGSISDFYSCFPKDKKLTTETLKENGFKAPPDTKNQKGNKRKNVHQYR